MASELPPGPADARRGRVTGFIGFLLTAVLVVLVTYLGYAAFEGSRQLTDPPNRSADCRTPAELGWEFEPVNYDPDGTTPGDRPGRCGPAAGDEVTGPGDVGLAGWYVPAAAGHPADAATLILAHGWGSNKSAMLDRAALLHDDYHLLFVDLRNHGQSGTAPTTQGLREANDLAAMLEWLVAEKGPDRIGVFGVSMGGASILRMAAQDDRVDAVIVEATHAKLAHAAQARLDLGGYPLSVPASWAILLGSLIRTGEDLSLADPVQSAARLGERQLLIVTGGGDTAIGPDDASELLVAAVDGGASAELNVCEAAGHGGALDACPEAYRDWVLGFLERHLPPGG